MFSYELWVQSPTLRGRVVFFWTPDIRADERARWKRVFPTKSWKRSDLTEKTAIFSKSGGLSQSAGTAYWFVHKRLAVRSRSFNELKSRMQPRRRLSMNKMPQVNESQELASGWRQLTHLAKYYQTSQNHFCCRLPTRLLGPLWKYLSI
jgi:hypothetical protein